MASQAYDRFMASTDIDYEKWHDGVGYDLDALRALTGAERSNAERWLLDRAGNDWRDLEGLLAVGTPTASAAVVEQLRHGKLEQRLWAARYLASDVSLATDREAATLAGIREAGILSGLRVTVDLANDLRTPAIIDALFRVTLDMGSEMPVHAAALLAFIHGKATEEFDWDLRPFFLRFNTQDRAEREVAFRELCRLCGVAPEPYLDAGT